MTQVGDYEATCNRCRSPYIVTFKSVANLCDACASERPITPLAAAERDALLYRRRIESGDIGNVVPENDRDRQTLLDAHRAHYARNTAS